jgi:predicted RNA methylase
VSVTGHRDVRLADDSYATPEWCTRLLLPHLQRGDVLEPCCGTGQIAKVIHETWNATGAYLAVEGVEIDPGRSAAAIESGYFDHVSTDNFLEWHQSNDTCHRWPLIVTNPPFSLALEFVKRSLEVADTVAMLLRLAWLSSAERNAFHREHPSDLIVLPKRPSFAKFVSCGGRVHAGGNKLIPCGWKEALPPDAPTPKACPDCSGKVKASTSDSADYGWFIWGPGRSGRIIHPEMSPGDVKKLVSAADREFEGAAAELEKLTR